MFAYCVKSFYICRAQNMKKGGSTSNKDICRFRCFLKSVMGLGCYHIQEQKRADSGFFYAQYMNKQSRKELAEITDQLEAIRDRISELLEGEQEKFDNLNEGLQQSERGQAIEEAISTLEEAETDIDNVIDNLTEIQ